MLGLIQSNHASNLDRPSEDAIVDRVFERKPARRSPANSNIQELVKGIVS